MIFTTENDSSNLVHRFLMAFSYLENKKQNISKRNITTRVPTLNKNPMSLLSQQLFDLFSSIFLDYPGLLVFSFKTSFCYYKSWYKAKVPTKMKKLKRKIDSKT